LVVGCVVDMSMVVNLSPSSITISYHLLLSPSSITIFYHHLLSPSNTNGVRSSFSYHLSSIIYKLSTTIIYRIIYHLSTTIIYHFSSTIYHTINYHPLSLVIYVSSFIKTAHKLQHTLEEVEESRDNLRQQLEELHRYIYCRFYY